MELKSTEDILTEYSDNVYLWEDNETLDVVIEDDKKFIELVFNFKCPKCNGKVVNGNESLINAFNDSVNGVQLKCNHCEQKLFIHKTIEF